MKRPHLFIPLWVVVAFGAVACNADAPLAPPRSPLPLTRLRLRKVGAPTVVRIWTLVLADTGSRIWVAQSTVGVPDSIAAGAWAGSAAWWSRLDSAPSAQDLTLHTTIAAPLDFLKVAKPFGWLVSWRLDGGGAAWSAAGSGLLTMDWRHRTWRSTGWAVKEVGGVPERVRFELIADTPMPLDLIVDPTPRGSVVVHTPAIVSLRIDDCMAADRVAFELLQRLRLTAEMGVPSRRVNRRGHCSKQLLDEMVAAGDLVESHSRLHGATPGSFGDFYLDVVGSAQDLRRRGFEPLVFIPPGTWRQGPTLMDSPGKLVGPYAELLRRVYVSTQSYALPAVVAVPVSGRDGPGGAALKWFTIPVLEGRLRQAVADSQWLSFMWHAWDMTPAELEARLRVIAALRDSGLVTVLPYYTALHATRQ